MGGVPLFRQRINKTTAVLRYLLILTVFIWIPELVAFQLQSDINSVYSVRIRALS